MSTNFQLFFPRTSCAIQTTAVTEALTHAAFHKPPKHHQCITVKQCQPVLGAGSESTTVTLNNNSTQPVCNVSTVYRHQRPDQLLNYQECLRIDLKKMCMSSVLFCIRHRLKLVQML